MCLLARIKGPGQTMEWWVNMCLFKCLGVVHKKNSLGTNHFGGQSFFIHSVPYMDFLYLRYIYF